MSLIAVLLSLLAERFLGALKELRRFEWFDAWLDWLRERVGSRSEWDGPLGVLIALVPPLLAAGLIYWLLGALSGVLAFLFAVLVLVFAFGPGDLQGEVDDYVDAMERGNEEGARWHAAQLLGDGARPESTSSLNRAVTEAVLVEAHERVFAVVFWFMLLGPVGALLFRLAAVLRGKRPGAAPGFAEAAAWLHAILSWAPARLLALAYGLSGSLVDALEGWRSVVQRWYEGSDGLLAASGLGALRLEQGAGIEFDHSRPAEALALVKRSLIIWLAVIAVLVLGGLIS